MGCIYCYTNLFNNKKYIGQTINDESIRRAQHKSAAFNPNNPDYNAVIHKAFRKYGYENFHYEIIANYIEDPILLNELEIYYIQYFNSLIPNGYNLSTGGLNGLKPMADSTKNILRWQHASLTEEEVKELRIAYKNKQSPKKIYDAKYKDRLHYNSFLNIWDGKRYATVMPEVFEKGRHTRLTKEKVQLIRKIRNEQHLTYVEIAKQFNVSKGTIADICNNRTWKNV